MFDRKRSWQRDDLYESIKALAEQCDLKLREFLFPLFIAISGREVSLPLFDSLIFLALIFVVADCEMPLRFLLFQGKNANDWTKR